MTLGERIVSFLFVGVFVALVAFEASMSLAVAHAGPLCQCCERPSPCPDCPDGG